MKATCFWIVALSVLLAKSPDGIRPRPGPSDYPAQEKTAGVTMAAQVIPPSQVRKIFATDLNKGGYIVIEVAVYPEDGKAVDLSASDFMLRIGSDSAMIRSVDADAIAAVLRQKNTPPAPHGRDVNVYTVGEVGYESGGYDPATGRRTHGVYTDTGVGVETGPPGSQAPQPPRPGSTDRDQYSMQQELQDKGLPEGKASQAVAGYLYFPKPSGKLRNTLYEVNWYGQDAKLSLSVPPPPK